MAYIHRVLIFISFFTCYVTCFQHNSNNTEPTLHPLKIGFVQKSFQPFINEQRYKNKSRTLLNHLQPFESTDLEESGRHRRRQQQQMIPMMMLMGITVFLMFVIPFGFFLGGKAFLMAKLALLLASINGLKRVASSGVHYGLYHTSPEFGPHHHGYDRNDFHGFPRQS